MLAAQSHMSYLSSGSETSWGTNIAVCTKQLGNPFQSRTSELSIDPSDLHQEFLLRIPFLLCWLNLKPQLCRTEGSQFTWPLKENCGVLGLETTGTTCGVVQQGTLQTAPEDCWDSLRITKPEMSVWFMVAFWTPVWILGPKIQTLQLLMKWSLESSFAHKGCLFCV